MRISDWSSDVCSSDLLKLQPALATSWENVEPTVWRFTLRKGVKFHNGNAFNADDVLFSIDRIRTEGSDMKVIANLIKEAVKVDDFTVDLVTPQPDPILPLQLEIFKIGRASCRERVCPDV